MRPCVSICVPTYLQVQYLRKTLDSISCQDFDNYELIISDDSPDASVENILSEYSFGSKLIYVRNDKPYGSPKNWNAAIAYASGEYIKLMHHDDWFTLPDSLSQYVKLIDDNPDMSFAFSGAIGTSAYSGYSWHHKASPRDILRLQREPTSLFYGNIIGPPSSTIYRRETSIVYDERFQLVVDVDFYIQMLLTESGFAVTKKPLITSTSGASHQVTNQCVNNRDIEIYEFFTLFDKIQNYVPSDRRSFYIRTLKRFIVNHRLQSTKELAECDFIGVVPLEIQLFFDRIVRSKTLTITSWHLHNTYDLLSRKLESRYDIYSEKLKAILGVREKHCYNPKPRLVKESE